MKTSIQGIVDLIKAEGKRNSAYKDTKGYWTIGVGHLIKDNEQHLINKTLTDKEVFDLLESDLLIYEKQVNDSIKVPLTQKQFDALVSICFNIGVNGFKNSSFVRSINKNANADEIGRNIMAWTKDKELISRRQRELNAFGIVFDSVSQKYKYA